MFYEYVRLFISKMLSPLAFIMAKAVISPDGYYYIYLPDTVTTKPKVAVFRRIKKAVTRMKRQ